MTLDVMDRFNIFLVLVLLGPELAVGAFLQSWVFIELACIVVGCLGAVFWAANHVLIPWIEEVP